MDIKLCLIAVPFLMMEMLPLRVRTTPESHDVISKTGVSCVGVKWYQVGVFRFWQRVACGQGHRREMEPPNPDEFSDELGPKRHNGYDPNFGHEPYWADGQWVFDRKPDNKSDSKYACGMRCGRIYKEYGYICARNKYLERQTFENYCAMIKDDCENHEKWAVLYRGKCYDYVHDYRLKPVDRAWNHLSSYMSQHTGSDRPGHVGNCRGFTCVYGK